MRKSKLTSRSRGHTTDTRKSRKDTVTRVVASSEIAEQLFEDRLNLARLASIIRSATGDSVRQGEQI